MAERIQGGCIISKHRLTTLLVITVAIALLAVGAVALHEKTAVQVVVQNVGPTPIREMIVHVTGNSYSIGDLSAGAKTMVKVRPTDESHVVIEYIDGDDKRQKLIVGCYFESGYGETIEIDIRNNSITRLEQFRR